MLCLKTASGTNMLISTARAILIAILHLAVFLVLFVNLTGVTSSWLEGSAYKKAVQGNVPDHFPVLVITPGTPPCKYQANVIYYMRLKPFLSRHPEYTFLVPEGYEAQLRQQVIQHNRSTRGDLNFGSGDPWNAWFTVKREKDGSQTLLVSSPLDEEWENEGWYKATAAEIKPIQYLNYVANMDLAVILPTLVEALILYGLVYYSLKWLWNSRPNRRS